MLRPLRSLLALVGLCALVACSSSGNKNDADAGPPPGGLTPEQASRVLAKVGDETITLGDYASAIDRMDPFDRLRYQTPEKRRDLLKEMVDLELLAKEAERRGIDKSPEVEEATRQTLRDAILDEAHKALPSPTELTADEIRAYYDAHIADYREPERRRVSVIVHDDEAKAKETLELALKDHSPTAWTKLFYERSLGAPKAPPDLSKEKEDAPLDLAGDLGIVGPPLEPKGANPNIPEPIRVAVFKLEKVGDVHTELVSDRGRWYVVRLNGRTPAHERSLAEADRQIRVELIKQRMREMDLKLEADLRAKYKVEIDEAALAKVSTAGLGPAPTAAPSAAP